MFCWKPEAGNWKPSAIAPCTLRVRLRPCGRQQTVFFVVGKNYRLQDIQLSKSAREATGRQLAAASQRRPLARQLLSKPWGSVGSVAARPTFQSY
jgi:hypothetical protein